MRLQGMASWRWALAGLVSVALLSACSKTPEEAGYKSQAPAAPKITTFSAVPVHNVIYLCDNHAQITAYLATQRMKLRLSPKLMLGLDRRPSDTGLKYVYADYAFSVVGKQATLQLPGNRPLHCREQSRHAP